MSTHRGLIALRGPYMYGVPGGLTIEEGKTAYTIELGKAFKAPH